MLNCFPKNPPLTDSAPFIVIGSGVAGLFCALELSKTGRVILITKAKLEESNTAYAQGGIAAVVAPNDSPQLHYQDTMMAGAGLCNSEAVLRLVYDGPERVKDLMALGVLFDKNQGEISLTREAAHSRRRILHANGDTTGKAISQSLIKQVRKSGITVYEEHFTLALISSEQHCCGAITINNGQFQQFLGGAVILCTGGAGQIYGKTTNPFIATGDGMRLAYNAGAVLRDLEFIQFHPTALCLPPAPPFLISESVRGEGAILLNSSGKRFMPDYHPLAELAPRDIVARSIFSEIKKDNEPRVFLDLSKIKSISIKNRFPNIYKTCLQYGLDITKNPIPVAPAAHYIMGGIQTDLWGRTNVKGLYAAGETASTGVHGANRLASNSLLEGLVFGFRIAEDLRNAPREIPKSSSIIKIHYPELFTDFENRESDLKTLHHIADQYFGIVRDEEGLKTAINSLAAMATRGDKDFEPDPAYFELQNLYQLSGLLAEAALTRAESRGGHFRSDFPTPKPEWRQHIAFHDSIKEITE